MSEIYVHGKGVYLYDNWTANFQEKEEQPTEATPIRVHRLRKGERDPAIIAELGGETVVPILASQFRWLMEQQANGQKGILLTDGRANIAYIFDKKGKRWAVDCGWDSGDRTWDVNANTLARPIVWEQGNEVFSR